MVKIVSVSPRSRADRVGIAAGDLLLSINGREINDVLDYRFYLAEKQITVEVQRGAEKLCFEIKKINLDINSPPFPIAR